MPRESGSEYGQYGIWILDTYATHCCRSRWSRRASCSHVAAGSASCGTGQSRYSCRPASPGRGPSITTAKSDALYVCVRVRVCLCLYVFKLYLWNLFRSVCGDRCVATTRLTHTTGQTQPLKSAAALRIRNVPQASVCASVCMRVCVYACVYEYLNWPRHLIKSTKKSCKCKFFAF